MEIYIGNLPDKLKSNDLRRIVRFILLPNSFTELLYSLFRSKTTLNHTRIEVINENNGYRPVRYAYADIQPDTIARRVIQRLDHLTYQGSSLRAREFITRDKKRDRRKSVTRNLYSVEAYNRRLFERRCDS